MQITAQHPKAIGQGSGVGMEKWLLLDRIALHAAHVAPGNVKFPSAVVANLANSGLTLRNGTTMSAGKAPNPTAIQ
jgi:hypothetical protein